MIVANEDLAELVRGHWVDRAEVAAALEGREASVRIVDQFPPGTEVRLVACEPAARMVPEGRATGTEKVGKDTVVEFSRGVKVGQFYFAVGEIEEGGEKFLRSMKVRGKFHGKDENIRPMAAFGTLPDEKDESAEAWARRNTPAAVLAAEAAEENPEPRRRPKKRQAARKPSQKGASELKDTAKKGSSDAQRVEKREQAGQVQTPKIKK